MFTIKYTNFTQEFNMSKKNILLLTVILLAFSGAGLTPVFAQTEGDEIWKHKFAIGLGAEINMHSPEGYAGGLSLNFDYNLPFSTKRTSFGAGISFIGSNNFDGITVLEPNAFFRWYLLNPEHRGLFAQINAGANIIFIEGQSIYNTPIAFVFDVRAGYRLPFAKNFYVEPYIRGGYPVVWGAGVILGMRLPAEPKPPSRVTVVDRVLRLFEEKGIKDTKVETTDIGVMITFVNLHFQPDSAELLEEDLVRITEVGNVIREIRNAKLLVHGHAARAGNLETLQQLSLDRADYISDYLVRNRIVRRHNVTTEGFGYSQPIASNDTEEDRQQNRRIVIYILLEG